MIIILAIVVFGGLLFSLRADDARKFEDWRKTPPAGAHTVYPGTSDPLHVLGVLALVCIAMLLISMALPQ